MSKIENKHVGFFQMMFRDFRNWRRDKCFCLKNFIYKYTKDMCFEKEEIEEINHRVEVTKKSEEKFHQWEGVMPQVREYIIGLQERVEVLEKEKMFCIDGIREIYIADVQKDAVRKTELFAKFGLPFVLENEKR